MFWNTASCMAVLEHSAKQSRLTDEMALFFDYKGDSIQSSVFGVIVKKLNVREAINQMLVRGCVRHRFGFERLGNPSV